MNTLRFATQLVLSTDLIMELLSCGYTRFQTEDTFENESIEYFLLEKFPETFKASNIKEQIALMFSEAPLKGKRTQKVVRKVFSWGLVANSQQVPQAEPTEEIVHEYSIKEEDEVDFDIQKDKSDILTEEVVTEESELDPWETMG